jgi:hypothetical protein
VYTSFETLQNILHAEDGGSRFFFKFRCLPKIPYEAVRVQKTNLNIFNASRRTFLHRTDTYFSKHSLKLAVNKELFVREEQYSVFSTMKFRPNT